MHACLQKHNRVLSFLCRLFVLKPLKHFYRWKAIENIPKHLRARTYLHLYFQSVAFCHKSILSRWFKALGVPRLERESRMVRMTALSWATVIRPQCSPLVNVYMVITDLKSHFYVMERHVWEADRRVDNKEETIGKNMGWTKVRRMCDSRLQSSGVQRTLYPTWMSKKLSETVYVSSFLNEGCSSSILTSIINVKWRGWCLDDHDWPWPIEFFAKILRFCLNRI